MQNNYDGLVTHKKQTEREYWEQNYKLKLNGQSPRSRQEIKKENQKGLATSCHLTCMFEGGEQKNKTCKCQLANLTENDFSAKIS